MVGDGDGEVFLSIEDDGQPIVEKKPRFSKPKKATKEKPTIIESAEQTPEEEIFDGEIIDTEVITQSGGVYDVAWPLLGMDCPDCAAKAMRAISYLPQVKKSIVSATAGEVRATVDLADGSISQISSILRSLGHAPDVEHHQLVGISASGVARRNGVEVKKLEKVIRLQPGILDCEIDSDNRILVQIVSEAPIQLIEARDASLDTILGAAPKYVEAKSARIRPDQWRLIGGGLALPILLIVFIAEFFSLSPTLIALIAIPGLVLGGLQMFKEAIASIRNRQLGFQVLTSLAVIGAGILGMWEEALIVAILVAFTAHLEGDALVKAREAMQGGLDRLPRTARRLSGDRLLNQQGINQAMKMSGLSLQMAPSTIELSPATGPLATCQDEGEGIEVVPIDLIRVGDQVEIRSGELIPCDGTILDGIGSLDKAPLTGESVPVEVSKGEEIQAGLILAKGPVVINVTAVGDNTRLSGLIEAVHTFREEPPRIQSGIEKFTAIWVPTVLFGAFAVWYLMFPDNWKIILLLWVVSCPCALLLATPVPHAAALANAAHLGVIARGGSVLERLSKVNHVLLDKTGTLTSGKPKIGQVITAKGKRRDSAIKIAAGLEARSNHPYALAIMELATDEGYKPSPINGHSDIEAGVIGVSSGKQVSLTRPDRLSKLGIEIPPEIQSGLDEANKLGHGASILCKEEIPIALFTFIHDDTREGSEKLIPQLYQRRINVEILSGDSQAAVTKFAKHVGIPENAAHGNLSPEDKVKWVRGRSKTHITMMVGDGFNDAAALAVSDVGVAVGCGETVNLDAADVLIPAEDPSMLCELIDLARKAQRILIANLVFSVAITIILVFAVINGMYDQLWVGVLIHEASVILVILNGARLAGNSGALKLLSETFKSLYFDTRLSFEALLLKYRSN
ncbi:MAG TPA: heavy metal translocating P-type ATPase [Candidatus Poseidoniales archaeon]|nr:heavy metal translocating P-type ATPase [Candidatus Poseidoniales archaeon]